MISSGKIINMKLNRTKCNLHMDGFLKKKLHKEVNVLCLLSDRIPIPLFIIYLYSVFQFENNGTL